MRIIFILLRKEFMQQRLMIQFGEEKTRAIIDQPFSFVFPMLSYPLMEMYMFFIYYMATDNLAEYFRNLSIEVRRRVITCLHISDPFSNKQSTCLPHLLNVIPRHLRERMKIVGYSMMVYDPVEQKWVEIEEEEE